MSNVWQVQEAKARFSEMLETSHFRGDRKIVTKQGCGDCGSCANRAVAANGENDQA